MASDLYIGVMSGTSLDGADAALVDLSAAPRVLSFANAEYPAALKRTLLALHSPAHGEIETAQVAANQLALVYADCVRRALESVRVDASDLRAIGCHGQTIRHRPDLGFTLQLQNPSRLAELTRITVVADFRGRDIAAGGQGAPLVPAFHDGVFRSASVSRVIINIGGISNITLLMNGHAARGFDCGPGNMLLDAWARRCLGREFDRDGEWGASGNVIPELLESLLDDAFFTQSPPKSTGRDLFSTGWLEPRLNQNYAPHDVQATLMELTAQAITHDILNYADGCREAYICGGGAQNSALVARINALLPGIEFATTDRLGIPAHQVEPVAFAWLAKQCLTAVPLDLSNVTGARHACILGAIYPA